MSVGAGLMGVSDFSEVGLLGGNLMARLGVGNIGEVGLGYTVIDEDVNGPWGYLQLKVYDKNNWVCATGLEVFPVGPVVKGGPFITGGWKNWYAGMKVWIGEFDWEGIIPAVFLGYYVRVGEKVCIIPEVNVYWVGDDGVPLPLAMGGIMIQFLPR